MTSPDHKQLDLFNNLSILNKKEIIPRPHYEPSVKRIDREPVNSLHNEPVMWTTFPCHNLIMFMGWSVLTYNDSLHDQISCWIRKVLCLHTLTTCVIVTSIVLIRGTVYGAIHANTTWVSYLTYEHQEIPKGQQLHKLKTYDCIIAALLWLFTRAPSQYKDRLIYVWWFPC